MLTVIKYTVDPVEDNCLEKTSAFFCLLRLAKKAKKSLVSTLYKSRVAKTNRYVAFPHCKYIIHCTNFIALHVFHIHTINSRVLVCLI